MEQYHPIVNMMSESELSGFLADIEGRAQHRVAQLPSHQKFINHYCKSEAP